MNAEIRPCDATFQRCQPHEAEHWAVFVPDGAQAEPVRWVADFDTTKNAQAYVDMLALLQRLSSFTLPKGNFPQGEDDTDDNAETLTEVIEEARAITGRESRQCGRCGWVQIKETLNMLF